MRLSPILTSFTTYKSFFSFSDDVKPFVFHCSVLFQHLYPLFLVSDFPFCVQPLDF